MKRKNFINEEIEIILFEYFGHEIFGMEQMMLLGQVYQRGEISNVVKFIPSLPNSMAEGACTLLTANYSFSFFDFSSGTFWQFFLNLESF